jgi:hypothetical protein
MTNNEMERQASLQEFMRSHISTATRPSDALEDHLKRYAKDAIFPHGDPLTLKTLNTIHIGTRLFLRNPHEHLHILVKVAVREDVFEYADNMGLSLSDSSTIAHMYLEESGHRMFVEEYMGIDEDEFPEDFVYWLQTVEDLVQNAPDHYHTDTPFNL